MTQTEHPHAADAPVGDSSASHDARYGRKRQRGIDRRFGFIAGGLLILGALGFFALSGWQENATIEFSDLRYEVVSDTEVSIGYEVTAPPQTPVACAIEALSTSFSTVGWKVVELPESETRHRTFSDTVRTTYPGTTATIRSCWVVEQAD